MKAHSFFKTGVLVSVLLCQLPAWAWGERGHDLISRVAVRLLMAHNPGNKSLIEPFARKELMLGHVASVPDFVWKNSNMGAHVNLLNRPTHWIDIDDLADGTPTFAKLPKTIAEAKVAASKHHVDLFRQVGSAPWRIKQFYTMFVKTLALIKPERPGLTIRKELLEAPVNQALLYGGLMAHFIGDLTQPHHSSKDYDSYDVGQGGLHAYFEEMVVDPLPLSFEYDVYTNALKNHPVEQLWQNVSAADAQAIQSDSLMLAWALAANNHAAIAEMLQLDKKYALIRPSQSGHTRVPAQRRPPEEVASHFSPFLLRRMALAADALAYLWQRAWEEAGKPDMQNYFSYQYALAPNFIEPDYEN